MNLIWNFDLFVVATTDEAEKPTQAIDNVYVGQALMKWTFNASGPIGQNKIWGGSKNKAVLPNPSTQNWADVKWTPLDANSPKPKVDGDRFNDDLGRLFWS